MSTKNETPWKCISYGNLWNMTYVLGALDGKHIAMDCPISQLQRIFLFNSPVTHVMSLLLLILVNTVATMMLAC